MRWSTACERWRREAARPRGPRRRARRRRRHSRPTSAPPTSRRCTRACCRRPGLRCPGHVDSEQPERRAADRVEEAPAVVRGRRRMGRRVQGGQAQRQLERDVGEASQARTRSQPLDFLKIGHHGSINATPPPALRAPTPRRRGRRAGTRSSTLSCRCPPAGRKPTAQAIVSTERSSTDHSRLRAARRTGAKRVQQHPKDTPARQEGHRPA